MPRILTGRRGTPTRTGPLKSLGRGLCESSKGGAFAVRSKVELGVDGASDRHTQPARQLLYFASQETEARAVSIFVSPVSPVSSVGTIGCALQEAHRGHSATWVEDHHAHTQVWQERRQDLL